MPSFQYRGVDADQKSVSGVIEAETEQDAARLLTEGGITAYNVERLAGASAMPTKKTRLTWDDLRAFNDALLSATRSGLPLGPALATLTHDLRKRRVRRVLDDLRQRVEAGRPLSEALEEYPKTFQPTYIAMVRAGEQTGNLPWVFESLGGYSRRMMDLRAGIQDALAYPALLIVVSTAILFGMFFRVIPVYASTCADLGFDLPLPTRIVIAVGSFVNRFPYLALGGVVLLGGIAMLILWMILADRSNGYFIDRIKLSLGVLGAVYAASSLGRFCRSLAMLIDAGTPAADGLVLAGISAGNAVLARAALQARQSIERGAGLADALKETGYFEHGFCWLLSNGETQGNVAGTLMAFEEDCQRVIDHRRRMVSLLVGPAVVILIGIGVGFLAVSLYLPFFKYTTGIGGF